MYAYNQHPAPEIDADKDVVVNINKHRYTLDELING